MEQASASQHCCLVGANDYHADADDDDRHHHLHDIGLLVALAADTR